MKKRILLFSLLICTAIFTYGQQVPREIVVLEIATGTWCQYCPGAAMGADDLVENGHPVGVIEYHSGDAYQNAASTARINYYNVGGYPTAKFDGVLTVSGGSQTQSMYGQYLPKVNQRLAIESSFTVDIFGEHTGNTYDITLVLNKVANYSGYDLVAQLALTESHIPQNWFGLTEVNFVERKMIPNHLGTELDFSNTDEIILELSFTLNSQWDVEHCELVAFIQSNASKEITQASKVMLEDLNPYVPPLFADFTVNDTVPCAMADVQFEDLSQGAVTAYYWSFPGGTPDTSNEESPMVYYEEPGEYDVTLAVSNGFDMTSTTKEDYINVQPLPEVEFSSVDDQCQNWPAIKLDQGSPEGGTYAGPGVDTLGYFDPAVAGVGEHILKYYYTGENACTDTAFQTVYVDECTGMPETSIGFFSVYPNPSNGTFTVLFNTNSKVEITIIDLTGKTVFQNSAQEVDAGQTLNINLDNYAQGVYYLSVKEDTENHYQKIIIQ